MQTTKRCVALTLNACLLLAGLVGMHQARADGGGDFGWVKQITDRGCYRLRGEIIGPYNFQGQGYVWTGPCAPGKPISGEGTFYTQYRDGKFQAETGRIVNGYPDGPMGNGLVYEMGCNNFMGIDCHPGAATNVVTVPQVSPALFPVPKGPSSFAESGSRPTAKPAPAATSGGVKREGCVSMDDKGEHDHGWQVVNNCPYAAIGSWCYFDEGINSCAKQKTSGFGPIKPGGSEAVASSPDGGAGYGIAWCDYEDWNAGDCAKFKPWEARD